MNGAQESLLVADRISVNRDTQELSASGAASLSSSSHHFKGHALNLTRNADLIVETIHLSGSDSFRALIVKKHLVDTNQALLICAQDIVYQFSK
jgi:hypothetical protein